MSSVYLDNAATTQIDPEVLDFMYESMKTDFGNPSSTHQFGRIAKSAIESTRKQIAKHLNVSASEIIFTAGGTEADNLILHNAVLNLGVKEIITSKIEHHAVLHTCEYLMDKYEIKLSFVKVDKYGDVDYNHLEELLIHARKKALVSLMAVNNEIGNRLDLDRVSALVKSHNALFHSDTVQLVGHYEIDLQKYPIDFMVASAHKFHGPKGVGFAYFRKGFGVRPMLHGGDQEKGARSSTENVHGILGMGKALDIAMHNLKQDRRNIQSLKEYFIRELKSAVPNLSFNGQSDAIEKSTYTILNVRFPLNNAMFLFTLDMAGIAASGGSACQSGSNKGSHVLSEILSEEELNQTSVRFSFSKFTTKEEIDITVQKIKELL